MDSLLNFGATVIVAILSTIGIWIQNSSKKRQEEMNKTVQDFRDESAKNDERIESTIVNVRMNVTKRYLVTEMTKILQGDYVPNEEQKRVLKEAKDEYNKAGGDSYVDDMYEDLRNRNLI